MSGLDKNRHRNKTVSFRVSPDEDIILEARIKVSGLPKGEYIIQSLLHYGVTISVGKYQSDRLSLELRRLHESLQAMDRKYTNEVITSILMECKVLLGEIESVTASKLIKTMQKIVTDEKNNKNI